MADLGNPESGRGRRRLRRVLLAAIALLYLLSVPWYWQNDARFEIWFGLPSWVAVALACYATAAILNALAWSLTEIPEALPRVADPGVGDEEARD